MCNNIFIFDYSYGMNFSPSPDNNTIWHSDESGIPFIIKQGASFGKIKLLYH
jgi:hypothetical protein